MLTSTAVMHKISALSNTTDSNGGLLNDVTEVEKLTNELFESSRIREDFVYVYAITEIWR